MSPSTSTQASPPVVGIVGGHGGMGSLFARFLAHSGASPLVSDRGTNLDNAALAARSDLILVAVPLGATPSVLRELMEHMRPTAALVSLGSLMEPASEAMAHWSGESFLLHPLFGPGRVELRGASCALATRREGGWQSWLVSKLHDLDCTVITTTEEEHDRTMAVAQALLHGLYATLTPQIAAALPASPDPLRWASPTLRLQLALMSRILQQDARLYGDLLALNRYTPATIEAMIERLAGLRNAAQDGPEAVAALFRAARESLGTYGLTLAAEGDHALGEGR